MSAHNQLFLHWLPVEAVLHAVTACGLDIDGSCDKHRAEGESCSNGLAWTRSRDLRSYVGRPYEEWPVPCETCLTAVRNGTEEEQE
jgi:hypothetical protein